MEIMKPYTIRWPIHIHIVITKKWLQARPGYYCKCISNDINTQTDLRSPITEFPSPSSISKPCLSLSNYSAQMGTLFSFKIPLVVLLLVHCSAVFSWHGDGVQPLSKISIHRAVYELHRNASIKAYPLDLGNKVNLCFLAYVCWFSFKYIQKDV